MTTGKPDDIPQDVWESVGLIFHTVANNHHAWGTLEQLPPEWGDDLQERMCRAILVAKKEAYRDAAGIVFASYRSRSELCYRICAAIRKRGGE